MNSDAAVLGDLGMGLGIVCRDENGEILELFAAVKIVKRRWAANAVVCAVVASGPEVAT